MESFSLINEEIQFPFGGQNRTVKKANLNQVMQFQRRAREINKTGDAAADLQLISYAIYLVLYAVDKAITEEYVSENARGDLDFVDVMATLGFMNQQKIATMRRARNLLENPKGETMGEQGTPGNGSTAQ